MLSRGARSSYRAAMQRPSFLLLAVLLASCAGSAEAPKCPEAGAAEKAPAGKQAAPALTGEYEIVRIERGGKSLRVADAFFGEDAKKCTETYLSFTFGADSVTAKVSFICKLYGGGNPLDLTWCKQTARAAVQWGDGALTIPGSVGERTEVQNIVDRAEKKGESSRSITKATCNFTFPKVPLEIVKAPGGGSGVRLRLRADEPELWVLEPAPPSEDERAVIDRAVKALRGG
jgi:hypothetical protein